MPNYAIVSFINFVGALLLGITLILYKAKSAQHRRLAYFNFSVVIWAFAYWRWQISNNPEEALFWIRVLTVGSVLIPTAFIVWVTTFLNELERFKTLITLILIETLVFIILTPTPLMIRGVTRQLSFPYWPVPGDLYLFFILIHYLVVTSFGLMRLLINAQKVTGIKRQRLRIVTAGFLIGQICGLTNFPLWYGIPIEPVGNFLVFVYPLSMSYSMLKYRFMDTRIILEETIARAVRVMLLLGLYLALAAGYSIYFHESINIPGYLITATVAAITTVFINDVANKPLHDFIDIHIFKKPPLSRQFRKLQEELTQSLDIQALHKTISTNLAQMLSVKDTTIASFNPDDNSMQVVGDKKDAGTLKHLLETIDKSSRIYVTDELREKLSDIDDPIAKAKASTIHQALEGLNVAICLPIPRKGNSISALLLSEKSNYEPFSVQEIEMLDTLRFHLSNALENVLLYERQLEFNSALKERVKEATAELQDAYNKLKQAGKMKDYIIDISSHELRTPASIIKSYLWLVLNEKKGTLNEKQKEALDRAYQSNERLLQIINDMLDVSRIEDGRLRFDYEKFDLIEAATKLMEEMEVKAKEKGLTLKLETEEKELEIFSDKDKIDEILLNLVGNAIKYTPSGSVTVKIALDDDGKSVTIKVSDTGIGIRKEDIPKLFTKFFRTEQTLVEIPTAGGTGLGLFITKSIVESLGGKITVESTPHKGTTFTVTLPVSAPENDNHPQDKRR